MESYVKMLHATKVVGAALLIIGMTVFFYGLLTSGQGTVMGIGIGIVMGATFTFIIGMILVASEEMVANGKKYRNESI